MHFSEKGFSSQLKTLQNDNAPINLRPAGGEAGHGVGI